MNKYRMLFNKSVISLAVVISFIAILAGAQNTYAASKIGLSVSLPDKAKPAIVKCRWKSSLKGVKFFKLKCVLLKSGETATGKTVYSKKLKKASGNITLKKLKKNKLYSIVLEAYDKSGNVVKRSGRTVTTGIPAPYFDKGLTAGYGDHIEIVMSGVGEQYSPDRAYLYRRAEGSKWEKIKTFKLNGKDYNFKYTDKNVETGRKYIYRARVKDTVKVKGKKKTLYSAYSEAFAKAAMNERGVLQCAYSSATPQQKEMSDIELDMTMDKYNYQTEFDFDKAEAWASKDLAGDDALGSKYKIAEYKLNDGEWQKAKGKVTVKAGEKFSMRFKLEEGQPLLDFTEDRRIAVYSVKYNGKDGYMMSIWPGSGRGSVHPTEWE